MREKFAMIFIGNKIAVEVNFRFLLGLLEGRGGLLHCRQNGCTSLLKVDKVVRLVFDHLQACLLLELFLLVAQGCLELGSLSVFREPSFLSQISTFVRFFNQFL